MRVVRDALLVRRCSSGSGVKLEREKRPPPLRVRPPPTQNIHRGGRRGLGMLPPQSACWEGKNKPENGEEEWGASIGNDGVGDLGFFFGGGGQRRSDVLTPERKSGGAATPPPSPPRTPEGWTALIYNPLLSLLSKDPGFPGRELNCELWIWVFLPLFVWFFVLSERGLNPRFFLSFAKTAAGSPPSSPPLTALPPSSEGRKANKHTRSFRLIVLRFIPPFIPESFLPSKQEKRRAGRLQGGLEGGFGEGGGGETRNASKPDK